MKQFITGFSIRHPRLLLSAVLAATVAFALQFPKVHFDNNPENMLAADEPVRVFHKAVNEKFALYDFVVVGVVNDAHPDGVFNPGTLNRVHQLTEELISLRRGENGQPEVVRGDTVYQPKLQPEGKRQQILNQAFRHDPEHLFTDAGDSAIIAREIIAPSVVDNIKQAERGQLKIEYLMETPPASRAEALVIRDDAMNNPLYRGTLVSEDGKAIGIYLPIVEKHFSHNVARLVEDLTADWPAEDRVYITGLPVAEDTFGIEMLVQMATSAPMAGLAIFILLFLFFRRFSLIIAPMIVAIVSVVCTMGLLIGGGYDVHIMSSMIAIFLMPIAVADSVHILSEFHDSWWRFKDKTKTLSYVIGHLFKPMLFTSLTTMAGFASLALTPIPPVKVFGLHVAFGVGLAWLLSISLVPAYIMLFVPRRSMRAFEREPDEEASHSLLDPALQRIGRFATTRWKSVIVAAAVLLVIAGFGISRIVINDNPINWFTKDHRIREADRVLNHHFRGTYTAYLTLASTGAPAAPTGSALAEALQQKLGTVPEALQRHLHGPVDWEALRKSSRTIDAQRNASWQALGDAFNFLEPDTVTAATARKAAKETGGATEADRKRLFAELEKRTALNGAELQDALLDFCDAQGGISLVDTLYDLEATLTAPSFKQPDVLAWVGSLQEALLESGKVGKTSSAVDALKKAHVELNRDPTRDDTTNQAFYRIPDNPSAVAQVFTQLEGMKKKDSLFHLVTRDYREASIWVQLTSGDNQDMESVVKKTEAFLSANPPPLALETGWSGLTYINVVWQDKMVRGMLGALGSSFIVVLVMMSLLFRSALFGLLSMIPLSLTIALSYGIIGLVGKEYDMPVAVLSALTLGLSIDFAIHFLQRARELTKEKGSWAEGAIDLFKEPARAISRNAIVISVGFTPLLIAPLLPYRTVGFFLATIMFVSWLATLFILAALATALEKTLFKKTETENRHETQPHDTGHRAGQPVH